MSSESASTVCRQADFNIFISFILINTNNPFSFFFIFFIFFIFFMCITHDNNFFFNIYIIYNIINYNSVYYQCVIDYSKAVNNNFFLPSYMHFNFFIYCWSIYCAYYNIWVCTNEQQGIFTYCGHNGDMGCSVYIRCVGMLYSLLRYI